MKSPKTPSNSGRREFKLNTPFNERGILKSADPDAEPPPPPSLFTILCLGSKIPTQKKPTFRCVVDVVTKNRFFA